MKTRKHRVACGDIVVEEAEKKQPWQRLAQRESEMFEDENSTGSTGNI